MSILEEAALSVIDAILEDPAGEFCRGDPGEVLGNLAEAAGVPYKTCSLAVLYLERQGLVTVRRLDGPNPRRANRIVCVEAT